MRRLTMVIATALCLGAPMVQAAMGQDIEAQAVKRVVEATTDLYNAEKLESLMALYSDDAKLYSRIAGGQVAKMEFREIVSRTFAQRNVSRVDTGNLKVSMTDPTHATVEGIVYVYLSSGGRGPSWGLMWFLEKRDGRWLVVESKLR